MKTCDLLILLAAGVFTIPVLTMAIKIIISSFQEKDWPPLIMCAAFILGTIGFIMKVLSE